MRLVIQRVSEAQVSIEGNTAAQISKGLMVLVGICTNDDIGDAQRLTNKLCNLRIFSDDAGLMNLSIKDINAELLLVSQFTLYASTQKGNRPSFIDAARPDAAIPLYEKLIELIVTDLGKPIATGQFGADMQVHLINDGPVTIIIDSKNRD